MSPLIIYIIYCASVEIKYSNNLKLYNIHLEVGIKSHILHGNSRLSKRFTHCNKNQIDDDKFIATVQRECVKSTLTLV